MITPVLLAGGAGTRLWPLSRAAYPKQFARLVGERSLFQASALRLARPGFASPLVVTHADFRFVVGEQLAAVGLAAADILIEPTRRNTAPAALAAALHAAAADPEALILLAPSDHLIPDETAFLAALLAGAEAARTGRLVTFGVVPDRPETGYGYLELPRPPNGLEAIAPKRFVEKPDAATAAKMLAAGNYLWNAGIFLCRANDLVAAFEAHAPEIVAPVREALRQARPDLGFTRLDPAAWATAPDISIDYAVMERADNLAVVPLDTGWTDLGSWSAVWRETVAGAEGVALGDHATAIDCRNVLLRSEAEGVEIVGIGLEDIVAVATADAVLVMDMSRAQETPRAIAALKARGAEQATTHRRTYRPWGWFERVTDGPGFQVKRIVVNPGGRLSLQSHRRRAEHWVVVDGVARTTIQGHVRDVAANQSVYVPAGAVHRLENLGDAPITLIEVQTGDYFGEDDIKRYDDVYARTDPPPQA